MKQRKQFFLEGEHPSLNSDGLTKTFDLWNEGEWFKFGWDSIAKNIS